jgi:hypothetical protein
VETLRKTHSGVKVRLDQCLCGSANGIKTKLEAQKCPTGAARKFYIFQISEPAETHYFPLKRGGWIGHTQFSVGVIAFYEKVIKVKADVAAYLINCFPSA